MSDQPQGPGWWQASDGKYYPPQSAPGAPAPPAPAAAPAGDEPPTGKKPIYKRWWFWLLAVILVVIIAVALSGGGDTVDETSDNAAPTEAPEAADDGAATEEAATDSQEAAQDEEPAEEQQEEASGPDGSRESPLPVGEAGTLGEWTVSIDQINVDANQAVADANEFNEPPEQGQYVLLTMTVTYNGSEEGSPSFDLLEVMVVDGVQYSDADAFAVAPEPSQSSAPTLENGGTVTFNAVLDVPTTDGAELFVEETLSFDDTRVYWQVP